jgi:CheY-like chemotaxis protein
VCLNWKGVLVAEILVVDDSPFLRKRVLEALRPDGHTFQEAGNGAAALTALSQKKFACVVTDLLMPEMDGFGLLAGLREKGIGIPAIVLTADIQKTTRARCEELGATRILNKPINPADLRSAVSQVLSLAVAVE